MRVLVERLKQLIFLFIVLQSAFGNENRRRLAPGASIISELNEQLNDGISHPRFSISALLKGDVTSNSLTEDTEVFEIDVVLTNPSVGESTTFSVKGFNRPVEDTVKLLVADNPKDFAILAVDEKAGSVSGIAQKDNHMFVKIEQLRDGPTVATQIVFDPGENWECMFDEHSNHEHVHEADHNENAFQLMSSQRHGHNNLRQLFGVDVGDENRKLYATDKFPNAWSYQVDLYIEVDDAFVANHDTDTTNMPNTGR